VNQEDIRLDDVARILRGQVPWAFLIEATARIAFVYLLLLVAMRLMGRRMASTLSRNELAALVSLAAATGAVIQSPERGLVPAVVIAGILVGVQRLIAAGAFRSKRIERATQGDLSILVINGELQLDVMKRCQLSHEQIFSHLREAGFMSLGRVHRLYMEAGGSFSFLRSLSPQPGLSLVPSCDPEFRAEQPVCGGTMACGGCGHVSTADSSSRNDCPRCAARCWTSAVAG
jgi:uncharacterized membrane protein YcaP (DUF421 family)